MQNRDLKPMLAKHAREIIQLLINQNIHFSVQCSRQKVQFDPELPEEISSQFHPIIDFILAGFTFDSIEIWQDDMSFEAGFGKDNFPSLVVIPFSSIIQITIPVNNSAMRDICVFMNAMNVLELDIFRQSDVTQELDEKLTSQELESSEEEALIESSKNAILSNPDNRF
ncbi:MAG: hypothetical protein MR025_08520 [Helicobacter trogontum]|uniref:Stringent starvation protein B n=1 Tax=Helicobacter trogontum TaxID=50960 RepID=A0A4V6I3E2_9HELI|nr:hypothetical protein [Helicobacter trogontum]MCI5787467.1 hypothetical protein [Helicobacter trogontum]TLD99662.1 hypothetical protein LS80_000175 [Helicobacter trogontum]